MVKLCTPSSHPITQMVLKMKLTVHKNFIIPTNIDFFPFNFWLEKLMNFSRKSNLYMDFKHKYTPAPDNKGKWWYWFPLIVWKVGTSSSCMIVLEVLKSKLESEKNFIISRNINLFPSFFDLRNEKKIYRKLKSENLSKSDISQQKWGNNFIFCRKNRNEVNFTSLKSAVVKICISIFVGNISCGGVQHFFIFLIRDFFFSCICGFFAWQNEI